jgi:dihydrofolate reductase
MRKLIVASFVSLDGVVEAPMSWIGNYFDDESKDFAYKKLMDVEFFLLGRVTYEMFSAVWPHVKGDRYISRSRVLLRSLQHMKRGKKNF